MEERTKRLPIEPYSSPPGMCPKAVIVSGGTHSILTAWMARSIRAGRRGVVIPAEPETQAHTTAQFGGVQTGRLALWRRSLEEGIEAEPGLTVKNYDSPTPSSSTNASRSEMTRPDAKARA